MASKHLPFLHFCHQIFKLLIKEVPEILVHPSISLVFIKTFLKTSIVHHVTSFKCIFFINKNRWTAYRQNKIYIIWSTASHSLYLWFDNEVPSRREQMVLLTKDLLLFFSFSMKKSQCFISKLWWLRFNSINNLNMIYCTFHISKVTIIKAYPIMWVY